MTARRFGGIAGSAEARLFFRKGGTDGMKPHTRKIIAPVVITCVIALYDIGFVVACAQIDAFPPAAKLVLGGIPLIFVGICISVLVERIKEIRSGEEDDLGQY